MRRFAPLLIAAAGLAAIVALFFALRPDAENAPEARPGTTPDATTTATESTIGPTTTEGATTTAGPEPRRIRIAVRGGRVVGGVRRVSLREGEQVVLVVSADVVDHVHIHGYDLLADVRPGRSARFTFVADISGRFDIELEDRALEIAELSVRP